jgi:glycosyltransferase involved in cell wall biosynthesis
MSAPVRVVAWVHGLYPHLRAGSETMLADMLEALAEAGHDVHAVADSTVPADGATSWEYSGVHCWREHHTQAAELVTMLEPDIIVSHHHIGLEALPLAKRLGVAAAAILHNDFKWSTAMVNMRPDLIVYNTHWLRRKLGSRGAASIIVHPPLHADRYALAAPPPDDGAVTIINLDKNKGPDVFYAVARAMPERRFLAVRGAYGRQDERDGYPNVEFMDTTEDVRGDIWARSRVVLAPSRYESYGRGVVEACAAGLPVVATATAGLRESLGYGGTFASRGNPAEWVRHVRRLTTDPGAWGRASRLALARAAELDAMRRIELEQWVRSAVGAARTARRLRDRRPAPTATA